MRKWTCLIVTLFVIASTAGCAGRMVNKPTHANASMVFGFIDLSEGATAGLVSGVEIVSLDQDNPGTFGSSTIKYGLFFQDDLPPGAYMVKSFQGKRLLGALVNEYRMPPYSQNEMKWEIAKPGIYYLGTYKFQMAGSDGFTLEPAQEPDEKQLLQWLLEESRGTTWEGLISKRLEEMS